MAEAGTPQAGHTARVEDGSVAGVAPLQQEDALARRLPERFALGADRGLPSGGGGAGLGSGAHNAASVPSTAVDMTERNIPDPWATATEAPGT